MQYILSQAEYDELCARQKLDLNMYQDQLQIVCTHFADTMPAAMPWRCILTAKFDHYCDGCPVQEICPQEHKKWSR